MPPASGLKWVSQLRSVLSSQVIHFGIYVLKLETNVHQTEKNKNKKHEFTSNIQKQNHLQSTERILPAQIYSVLLAVLPLLNKKRLNQVKIWMFPSFIGYRFSEVIRIFLNSILCSFCNCIFNMSNLQDASYTNKILINKLLASETWTVSQSVNWGNKL